mmetsp:Transcript_7178/g.17716  ORF Transcript_7178/g.17716 Transcript_7178/m.17716 type:complete len:930 (-) Transcript_7178:158-2947(-)
MSAEPVVPSAAEELQAPNSAGPGRRLWTAEEDKLLAQAVGEHGPHNWARIATAVGTRKDWQCCERWRNHLAPDVCKDPWTPREDDTLLAAVTKIGHKWSKMVTLFPSRTSAAIKNRFHTLCRRASYHSQQASPSASPALGKRRLSDKSAGSRGPQQPVAATFGALGGPSVSSHLHSYLALHNAGAIAGMGMAPRTPGQAGGASPLGPLFMGLPQGPFLPPAGLGLPPGILPPDLLAAHLAANGGAALPHGSSAGGATNGGCASAVGHSPPAGMGGLGGLSPMFPGLPGGFGGLHVPPNLPLILTSQAPDHSPPPNAGVGCGSIIPVSPAAAGVLPALGVGGGMAALPHFGGGVNMDMQHLLELARQQGAQHAQQSQSRAAAHQAQMAAHLAAAPRVSIPPPPPAPGGTGGAPPTPSRAAHAAAASDETGSGAAAISLGDGAGAPPAKAQRTAGPTPASAHCAHTSARGPAREDAAAANIHALFTPCAPPTCSSASALLLAQLPGGTTTQAQALHKSHWLPPVLSSSAVATSTPHLEEMGGGALQHPGIASTQQQHMLASNLTGSPYFSGLTPKGVSDQVTTPQMGARGLDALTSQQRAIRPPPTLPSSASGPGETPCFDDLFANQALFQQVAEAAAASQREPFNELPPGAEEVASGRAAEEAPEEVVDAARQHSPGGSGATERAGAGATGNGGVPGTSGHAMHLGQHPGPVEPASGSSHLPHLPALPQQRGIASLAASIIQAPQPLRAVFASTLGPTEKSRLAAFLTETLMRISVETGGARPETMPPDKARAFQDTCAVLSLIMNPGGGGGNGGAPTGAPPARGCTLGHFAPGVQIGAAKAGKTMHASTACEAQGGDAYVQLRRQSSGGVHPPPGPLPSAAAAAMANSVEMDAADPGHSLDVVDAADNDLHGHDMHHGDENFAVRCRSS